MGRYRTIWSQALILLLLSMIVNTMLKNYFAIPLNPALHAEGFAFPSGHIQCLATFYGWVLWQRRKVPWIRIAVPLIWIMQSAGMLYFGYHNLRDIAGGLTISVAIIAIAQHLVTRMTLRQQRKPLATVLENKIPWQNTWLLGVGAVFIANFLMTIIAGQNSFGVISADWTAFYLLCGFTSAWRSISQIKEHPMSRMDYVKYIVCLLCAGAAVKAALNLLAGYGPMLANLPLFFLGAAVPGCLAVNCVHLRLSVENTEN